MSQLHSRAYAPPAFDGLAAICSVRPGVGALILGHASGERICVASFAPDNVDAEVTTRAEPLNWVAPSGRPGRADEQALTEAVDAAMDRLTPGRLEWGRGRFPSAQGWSDLRDFAFARLVDHAGRVVAVLVPLPSPTNREELGALLSELMGCPVIVLSPDGPGPEAPARSIAFSVASGLDALPPARKEYFLEEVLESGTALAIWRTRAVSSGSQETQVFSREGARWRIGAVILEPADGHLLLTALGDGFLK